MGKRRVIGFGSLDLGSQGGDFDEGVELIISRCAIKVAKTLGRKSGRERSAIGPFK